jgi:cell division septum initiation protein DivIVA
MARPRGTADISTLQMALVGYQLEKERIEEKIRELRKQIGGRAASTDSTASSSAPRKRSLSPAARKRIAAAQRRRWAEHRKKNAQQAKAAG